MSIDLVAEPLNDQVVERIRVEMARRRVTQTELARLLGHPQAYVSWRLTGKTMLKLVDVEEIAHALGISPDLLLVSEGSPIVRRRRAS